MKVATSTMATPPEKPSTAKSFPSYAVMLNVSVVEIGVVPTTAQLTGSSLTTVVRYIKIRRWAQR